MISTIRLALAALWIAALVLAPAPAAAQSITSADIDRLENSVADISGEIGRLRARDRSAADRYQRELDDLQEEVVYLKVKMRRERNVPRSEYTELRDRLAALRSKVTGASGVERPDPGREIDRSRPASTGPGTVPVNQEMDVRLITPLSSETAQVEDRFQATTLGDLTSGGDVLVPAGSELRGVVTSVEKASRGLDRKGKLTLSFDQITVRGRNYPLRATVINVLEAEGLKGEAGKIGTGAGVGAVIGAVIGGVKGALIGILVGAGGTIAATEGKDVELASGTILRVRFDSPLEVR
jgi:hypothetical protein